MIALCSFGVGTLLRVTSRAVMTVLGLLFVLPLVGAMLPGGWGRTVNKLLPTNAGAAITSGEMGAAGLSPWAGLLALAAYTLLILAAAVLWFERRDV
jgi:ABC-2 type transport system permease protein